MNKRRFAVQGATYLISMTTWAAAQVPVQPPKCEFRAVYVIAPDTKTASMKGDAGKLRTDEIASLGVILDGKPNFFRTECMIVDIPASLNEQALLDDMQTIAQGNNLRNATAWVEKEPNGMLIGRARGQISDTTATYIMDIRRYFSQHNMFDVWIGSPPGTFPSEGNLIFLKELRRYGKPLF